MRDMTDYNQNFFSTAAKRIAALINSQPRTPSVKEIEQAIREAWQDTGPFHTPEGREAWRRKLRGETP